MKLASLEDMLIDELRDLYSAENQLVKALPRMAKASTSAKLRQGFERHLQQTRRHAERLQQVCDELGASPKGKKCVAMEGLIEEGKELMSEDAPGTVRDAALIAAAQKVEHYEIASYGTVCAWAEQLGHRRALRQLQQTLEEEKQTDEKLSQLAEKSVNAKAAAEPSEQENGDSGITARFGQAAARAKHLVDDAVETTYEKTKQGMKAARKLVRNARKKIL